MSLTSDLQEVVEAFASAPSLALAQSWLEACEPDFAPGQVQTGWYDRSLLVLARLTDRDIYTAMTGPNQRAWMLGDAFEIFLRPAGHAAYFELHVAPNNCRLQMRFPNAGCLIRAREPGFLESLMVPSELFRSRTWVQREAQCWCVLAEIPADNLREPTGEFPGSQWHFSFSRYDYTRGRATPVISSTSPHAVPKFHRQEEWGLMIIR